MTTTLAAQPIGLLVDSHPGRRPKRVTLKGRLVTLAPLDADAHAEALFEGSNGDAARDRVWTYLSDGPYRSLDEFRANIEDKARSADPLYFAVIDNRSGRAVGYQTMMRIDAPNRVIEVGNVMYTPAMQRTAGATEAQYLFARHVFDELDAPSRRAAERFGFAFEGIFRQHRIVKGRNRDTAWFAMLDSEWPARKAAFERWLEPDNFDDAGRQKARLSEFMQKGT